VGILAIYKNEAFKIEGNRSTERMRIRPVNPFGLVYYKSSSRITS